MTRQELFIISDQALQSVIAQISDAQYALSIPEWFQVGGSGNDNLTLRKIINYHAYDEAWVPAVLTGRELTEAIDAPTDKNDDLLGGASRCRL